ncbi:hypothetical protein FDECE_2964 [Fusarium decemcellulare]|nr:hypothetical protein FDECE_2964 [Fusarium decemcellulare]
MSDSDFASTSWAPGPQLVENDLPVPTYSATDDDNLFARVEQTPTVEFPILCSPARRPSEMKHFTSDKDRKTFHKTRALEYNIVESFFYAIINGHDDLVADFISRGWVSPDTTNGSGETPLLAAVHAGRTPMVSRLVALGATVNAFGKARGCSNLVKGTSGSPERTPLMVAADEGHLALVKVLMEYGADDSLIAPDGAIAIRLAARNRHREIVQFLPSRRGGAWIRWKTAHEKEMERVRRAWKRIVRFLKVSFWEIPTILLYHIPKDIAKAIWKRRHRMAEACRRLPGQIKKAVVALPGTIVRGSKAVWRGIKGIPSFFKDLAVAIWKVLKEIPGAVVAVLKWIGRGFKSIGEAIVNILTKFLSMLHTIVMAVVTFFRGIKLVDIWNGFCYLVRAIFVDAPKAIGAFIVSFGKMSYELLKSLFGVFGKIIWWIGYGILWLIQYLPRKVWTIIEAFGASMVRGYQELMSYLNPKHM